MRADLPQGTITFLFTDIEGSTRLLDELGTQRYAEALAEHRLVVRKAVVANDGVEVDTQGDAFFVAFPTAPGALAAAATVTHELTEGPVRVRIGLHTGTPLVTDEGYVGHDVHRAARIAAAGHGGQVLVSASTATLTGTETLRDLGEHRFKDLGAAERIYQLGGADFPPLKSLYRTNLPVPTTVFLGRAAEVTQVSELLTDPDVRLVTLTGPGGTGKTRLALQAAAEAADAFPDGLWWVPLAALRDPRQVMPAIAAALAIPEQPGESPADGLARRLSGTHVLLLLDNVEHLLPDAAVEVARLREIAGPTLLVTSRERLQLQGEHVYPVAPLAAVDGVELFRARASELDPSFVGDAAVAELCQHLDQLPLALELAAARTVLFTPAQLLARLSERLDLLRSGRDADHRQQTLRSTIEWSYDLLDPGEQELFTALSVFVGGCTYDGAEAVCDATPDTLQSLLDKSLLRRRTTDLGARYWMLETIREFAREQLGATGRLEGISRRHAEHHLALAESLGMTMESIEVVGRQRFDVALAEQDNFRAAIDWAVERDGALAARILVALESFWNSCDPAEGIRRVDSLLAREDQLPARLRAELLRSRGNCTVIGFSRAEGVDFYRRSVEEYARLGDEVGVAMVQHRINIQDVSVAPRAEHRAVLEADVRRFRELGIRSGEADSLFMLGWFEHEMGNVELGTGLLERAVDQLYEVGFTWMEQRAVGSLSLIELRQHRLPNAARHAVRALALASAGQDLLGSMGALTLLARIAVEQHDLARAGQLWGAVETETARGPYTLWRDDDPEEEAIRRAVLAHETDPGFASGRVAGRLLSLAEAVELALDR